MSTTTTRVACVDRACGRVVGRRGRTSAARMMMTARANSSTSDVAGGGDATVVREGDAVGCGRALATRVRALSRAAIARRGTFSIGVAGGSLIDALAPLKTATDVEWSRWRVFWVDERCVKWTSEDSNFGGAYRTLFADVDVPRERLHAIDETLCEGHRGAAEACARAYEDDLRALTPHEIEVNDDGFPVFDVLLLGFGPDGHICSLFPHHELLTRDEGWILPIADSPKPPPERVTFSLPVVNAAREKIFVAMGSGKAEMTAKILKDAPRDGSVPAALVKGNVRWIVDDAAAALL